MPKPDWDKYFMNIAHVVKLRSNCLARQTGAVLVKDRRIITTGYNGTPTRVRNCDEGGCERCAARVRNEVDAGEDLDKCACSHAEENAVVQSALHGISAKETTIYTTHTPCTICAKMIINAGIAKVVANEEYPDNLGTRLLKEAGVELVVFSKPG